MRNEIVDVSSAPDIKEQLRRISVVSYPTEGDPISSSQSITDYDIFSFFPSLYGGFRLVIFNGRGGYSANPHICSANFVKKMLHILKRAFEKKNENLFAYDMEATNGGEEEEVLSDVATGGSSVDLSEYWE